MYETKQNLTECPNCGNNEKAETKDGILVLCYRCGTPLHGECKSSDMVASAINKHTEKIEEERTKKKQKAKQQIEIRKAVAKRDKAIETIEGFVYLQVIHVLVSIMFFIMLHQGQQGVGQPPLNGWMQYLLNRWIWILAVSLGLTIVVLLINFGIRKSRKNSKDNKEETWCPSIGLLIVSLRRNISSKNIQTKEAGKSFTLLFFVRLVLLLPPIILMHLPPTVLTQFFDGMTGWGIFGLYAVYVVILLVIAFVQALFVMLYNKNKKRGKKRGNHDDKEN